MNMEHFLNKVKSKSALVSLKKNNVNVSPIRKKGGGHSNLLQEVLKNPQCEGIYGKRTLIC